MTTNKGVKGWVREQLTFQNIMAVATMIAVLSLNTGRWVSTLNTGNKERDAKIEANFQAIQALISNQQSLVTRIEVLERAHYQQNDETAKEFPRRSELEPRLRGIEEKITETSRQIGETTRLFQAWAQRQR